MNQSHLDKLLSGDVEAWNKWRQENPEIRPDLSAAFVNSRASRSTLGRPRSIFNRFQSRDLRHVDLHRADLRLAKIWIADLTSADLRGAEIRRTSLREADLRGSDLRDAQFLWCDLQSARLEGSMFGQTYLGFTTIADAHGLDEVQHRSTSPIDQLSIISSMPISEPFLRACGVQEQTIRMAQLHMHRRPYHTCFISYSRLDESFVGHLREALTRAGVPNWFAPQDMRREEFQNDERELERDLYDSIDAAECLLLVVSPNILRSGWVGEEVQRTSNPIVPLLIETMPLAGSHEWNALIAQVWGGKYSRLDPQNIGRILGEERYTQLNPQYYSERVAQLLRGPFLDFRNCRYPSTLIQCLPTLLSALKRR